MHAARAWVMTFVSEFFGDSNALGRNAKAGRDAHGQAGFDLLP